MLKNVLCLVQESARSIPVIPDGTAIGASAGRKMLFWIYSSHTKDVLCGMIRSANL